MVIPKKADVNEKITTKIVVVIIKAYFLSGK